MNMRTKMVKWGLRAGLVIVALLIVLGASCLIPASVGDGGAAQAQEFEPYAHGGSAEEALSSGSLPEVLAGPGGGASGGGFGGGGDREDGFGGGGNSEDDGESGNIFQTGGSNYVNSAFNKAITKIHEVFLPLGYCIMFVCWIIGMCKSGMSLSFDPSAKDGILRSGLTLMLGLFLMEVSMEIMESLSALCWEYCKSVYAHTGITENLPKIVDYVSNDDVGDALWIFDDIYQWLKTAGLGIIALIVEAVLLLNVAYMGLLQCFSPIFVGFAAGGEGTRRFATSFFKEYLKVCLVPPVLTVYVGLCFELFTASNIGVFLCIVLGISVFGIGKKLDKIIT